MNCQEVQNMIPHYLANEVSASLRKLIQAHLTGCAACRSSLEQSAALQQELRSSLLTAARAATPSENAWDRLAPQLTLTPPARHKQNHLINLFLKGYHLMKKPVIAALALLIVLVGAATLVPPVRAQMQGVIADWFGFKDPQGYLRYDTNWGFAPYAPTYLPAGMRLSASMTAGEEITTAFGLLYTSDQDGRFAALIQTRIDGDYTLPAGRSLQVQGRTARLQIGAQIDLKNEPDGKRAWIADRLQDEGVRRLTWNMGEVQIDLVSNLPEDELLRIAEQLAEAPSGFGPLK